MIILATRFLIQDGILHQLTKFDENPPIHGVEMTLFWNAKWRLPPSWILDRLHFWSRIPIYGAILYLHTIFFVVPLHERPALHVFKIATLVHRSLSGLAPGYLPMIVSLSPTLEQVYCVPLTRWHWLSTEPPAASGTGPLQLRHKSVEQFAGWLTRWNAELSYSPFRRSLKTFFFGQSDHGSELFFFWLRRVEIFVLTLLTYLHIKTANMRTMRHYAVIRRLNVNVLPRNITFVGRVMPPLTCL